MTRTELPTWSVCKTFGIFLAQIPKAYIYEEALGALNFFQLTTAEEILITNFDAELHIYIKKRDFALNFDKQSVEVTKKLLPTTLFLSKYAEHFIEPISRNSWISIFEEKLLPEIK
ncbi:unnamed protein product [Rhizophagus irregularis]|nr:unnamed protein product [Rhizophagus irregularis]